MTGEFDTPTIGEASIPKFEYDRFNLPKNIELDVYLAPHDTSFDLPENLHEIIGSADIVVIETEGGHKATEINVLTSLSNGDVNASNVFKKYRQYWKNPLWKNRFYEALYGTGVTIVVPDIEIDDPITQKTREVVRRITHVIQEPNYFTAVAMTAETLKERLRLLKLRDQHILETVTTDIQTAIEESDILTAKIATREKVSVVMFYGGLHESLFDALALKALDEDTSTISKHDELAVQMVLKDIYDKYLRGEKIQPIEYARYGLETILHLINQVSPNRDGDKPSQSWVNDIYVSVNSLTSGKQINEYRNKALDTLRSLTKIGSSSSS